MRAQVGWPETDVQNRVTTSSLVTVGSLGVLGEKMLEIDPPGLVATVKAFNAAVGSGTFNPAVLDGKGTHGVVPPKSNWAQALDTPPFVGYAVTCGITFTFGGVRVTPRAEVLDTDDRPIPGLLAAGELVGRVTVREGDGLQGASEAMLQARHYICDSEGSRAAEIETEPGGIVPSERAEIQVRSDRATGAGELVKFGELVWYRFSFKIAGDWPRDVPAAGRPPCRTVIQVIDKFREAGNITHSTRSCAPRETFGRDKLSTCTWDESILPADMPESEKEKKRAEWKALIVKDITPADEAMIARMPIPDTGELDAPIRPAI